VGAAAEHPRRGALSLITQTKIAVGFGPVGHRREW
jgi:hypothetical protein